MREAYSLPLSWSSEPRRTAYHGMATVHDERVDDSATPLAELRRLAGLRRAYRKLGAVLFEDGPLFSDVNQTDPADLEQRACESSRWRGGVGGCQF